MGSEEAKFECWAVRRMSKGSAAFVTVEGAPCLYGRESTARAHVNHAMENYPELGPLWAERVRVWVVAARRERSESDE